MSKNNADLLRMRLRAERKTMSVDLRQRQSQVICQTLKTWFATLHCTPRVVAAFWPMADEPDLRPLLEHLDQSGVIVVLPVVVKRHAPLGFYRWTPETPLAPGNFGVMEPPCTQAFTPDLLLVPTLGFTSASDRLGYGGGYYDRTLAALHAQHLQIMTIGIAWEQAQLDSEPQPYQPQAHDVRLDAMLTGQGWRPGAPAFKQQ